VCVCLSVGRHYISPTVPHRIQPKPKPKEAEEKEDKEGNTLLLFFSLFSLFPLLPLPTTTTKTETLQILFPLFLCCFSRKPEKGRGTLRGKEKREREMKSKRESKGESKREERERKRGRERGRTGEIENDNEIVQKLFNYQTFIYFLFFNLFPLRLLHCFRSRLELELQLQLPPLDSQQETCAISIQIQTV
jgi:hypothetical protein